MSENSISCCSFTNEAKKSNKNDVEITKAIVEAHIEFLKTMRQLGSLVNTAPMINIGGNFD